MRTFRCTVEGARELRRAFAGGARELRDDLAKDAYRAARDGIARAKADHPYTDRTGQLTGTATVEITRVNGDVSALMQWPQPYASFVDQGTQRSKPYPFTPQAERSALETFDLRTKQHIAGFLARFA